MPLASSGAPAIDLPPEFLDVVQYKAGSSVKLWVGIVAQLLPSIEWLKDGKELLLTSKLSVESTTDSTAILIKDAARSDSGSYEIKIKNILGSATANIRVQILGDYTNPLSLDMFTCFNVQKALYLSHTA